MMMMTTVLREGVGPELGVDRRIVRPVITSVGTSANPMVNIAQGLLAIETA
jgi:hypothetical protein